MGVVEVIKFETTATMGEISPIAFSVDRGRDGSKSRVPGHETGQRATKTLMGVNAIGGCGGREWGVVLWPLWGG